MKWAHADTKSVVYFRFLVKFLYIPPYGCNMQIFSIYRPMISIYTANISNIRTSETIAIVKILLPILQLLPLYYNDSIIAKVTIAMHG